MRISPLGHVGPLVSFIGKRMSMILKGLDESFTASIGLMMLRARSLEICSQTHTKDPDLKKDPTLAWHRSFPRARMIANPI